MSFVLRIMYTLAEAMHVVDSLCQQNLRHPKRFYATKVKQQNIAENKIYVKKSQLNNLIKANNSGSPPWMFWNSRGWKEVMPLEELCNMFDVHTQQDGNGWTEKDTMEALIGTLERNLENNWLDSSHVSPPCQETALAYNAALVSMPDLILRSYQAKNANREAAETSICSMLSFVATNQSFCQNMSSTILGGWHVEVISMALPKSLLFFDKYLKM